MGDNITIGGFTFATREVGGVHFLKQLNEDSSYKRGANVAPGATALAEVPDALYVGGAGNLVVRGANGADVTFAMDAKSILPFAATHVLAATTATNVVALYLD